MRFSWLRRSPAEYAPDTRTAARQGRWSILFGGGLLLALLLPLLLSLGHWQWRKAEEKIAAQAALATHAATPPLTSVVGDPEQLRYRRVVLRGHFDASRQVLIDNRLHHGRAGYHVLTPLQLPDQGGWILVNRGWLPAAAEHRQTPAAPVPSGEVEISGVLVIPPARFFTLAKAEESAPDPAAPAVWQNLDLERFRSWLGAPLPKLLVLLDANAAHGFVRDWPRPDERSERHRSYALQWYGFAVASLGIWLYLLLRRP